MIASEGSIQQGLEFSQPPDDFFDFVFFERPLERPFDPRLIFGELRLKFQRFMVAERESRVQ